MRYTDRLVAIGTMALVIGHIIAHSEAHSAPTLAPREPSAICDTWAATINAEHDAYFMHVRGCDSDPRGGGEWQRLTERCATLAYSYGLHVWADGRVASDTEIFAFMSTYQFGCVVYEDGTWYEE